MAVGIATRNRKGEIIEVYYPDPCHLPRADLVEAFAKVCSKAADIVGRPYASKDTVFLGIDALKELVAFFYSRDMQTQVKSISELAMGSGAYIRDRRAVACLLTEDKPPQSVEEAYLKLHLLSHRLVKPPEVNLDGIFKVLPNNAWTSTGAVSLDDLPEHQIKARVEGNALDVRSVDKFPPMCDYIVPSGVRIADTARVRLGAYVGEGTTVMHEGFINFNAGTEGPAMIEGRLSAGVMVGAGSDLGGGASTMGTLSGGGSEIVSVGKNCLIGANAGIGMSLADGCTVEAGLYVTAGTKVKVLDEQQKETGRIVKAKELSKVPNILFRRNSISGAVECVPLESSVALNEALHSHN